jgi:hypothetical protein
MGCRIDRKRTEVIDGELTSEDTSRRLDPFRSFGSWTVTLKSRELSDGI